MLHVPRDHPVGRVERREVSLPMGLARGATPLGFDMWWGAPKELLGRARRLTGDAVFPGCLSDVNQRLSCRTVSLTVEEATPGTAVLKQRFDLLVGVAFGVGGHHNEALPV